MLIMNSDLSNSWNLAQQISNSPYFHYALQQQEVNAYHEKLADYQNKRRTLTNREIKDLIVSIAKNKNSFQNLQLVVPRLNSPTLLYYLVDNPKPDPDAPKSLSPISNLSFVKHPYYFELETIPEKFYPMYEFQPSDRIALSITGENEWDKIQMESRQNRLMLLSLFLSAVAAVTGIISLLR